MPPVPHNQTHLVHDLTALGVRPGDGLFVHASMKAIGATVGGAATVIQSLCSVVGETGLIGMPGFSSDAYFPADVDRSLLTPDQIADIEHSVPGFNAATSPTSGMGIVAETFRKWPGTRRSDHPTVSICLNGAAAQEYVAPHSLAWATGRDTPLGRLCGREAMKILLIGVGWNRCSALHTAETFSHHKRTKTRRFKIGGQDGSWMDTPDVADDLNRLFPSVGAAFEETNAVSFGRFGDADCRICAFRSLVEFATDWIDSANQRTGDRR